MYAVRSDVRRIKKRANFHPKFQWFTAQHAEAEDWAGDARESGDPRPSIAVHPASLRQPSQGAPLVQRWAAKQAARGLLGLLGFSVLGTGP